MEEVGADEEEEDEGGRGVGGDEEKGEPAAKWSVECQRVKHGSWALPSQAEHYECIGGGNGKDDVGVGRASFGGGRV